MRTFVRIAAITGGLFLASATFAQDKAAAPAASKPTPTATTARVSDNYLSLPIARMKEELKLSDEQTNRLKEADATAQKEKGALDAKLSNEERAAKTREILARRDKQVSSILTPEQNKQWSAHARTVAKREGTMAAPQPAKATEAPAEKK